MKKRPSKKGLNDMPIRDGKCANTLSGNCLIQQQTTTTQQEILFKKKLGRIQLLHDLKKIAIAINELCRDLDRIEHDNQ